MHSVISSMHFSKKMIWAKHFRSHEKEKSACGVAIEKSALFHNTQIYAFLRICIAKRSELISQYHHLLSNSIRSNPTFTLPQVAWASPKYAMHSSPYMIHDTAFFQRNLMISQYCVDTQEAALLHESQTFQMQFYKFREKRSLIFFTNR